MSGFAKFALGALMLTSTAAGASPANSGPAPDDGSARARPCHFYVHRDMPAPRRCYRFFYNALGPNVIMRDGYVFRNKQAFLHFRDREEMREHRFAQREDRDREREDTTREHEDIQQAEGPPPPPPPSSDKGLSGGASRGSHVAESASGGASRGSHVPENRSGGASGY